jgi:hypothetical protein
MMGGLNVPISRLRSGAMWAGAFGVFLFSWLFRFNDPGGAFAGLTDDHFFYLVRGWQILFGDLPVRDFVDHGAPLFYYLGAAVQVVLGRGTLSELVFCVTALAAGAAATFWLAARASGSVAAGLAGAAFHVLLAPRLYNYPKIVVYAAAIPALWWYADKPSIRRLVWIAAVAAVGFLFRHDHGVFVAAAAGAQIALLSGVPWRVRAGHAIAGAAMTCLLLAPYLAFIESNGGLAFYVRQAADWAEKDRSRAPIVWPGLFDNPEGVSEAAHAGSAPRRAAAVIGDNRVAWLYYVELALPVLALVVLALSQAGLRPSWPRARGKLAAVAVLALVLEVGFLRAPLEARLADPSVPLAILVAWLAAAVPRVMPAREWLRPGLRGLAWPVRAAVVAPSLAIGVILVAAIGFNLRDRLDKAAMAERVGLAFERVGTVSAQLRQDWPLEAWTDRPGRPALMDLALYLNACTEPTDRVLVQAYIPQVLALARRAFAGGHADLRPGFFRSGEAQRLTVARLERQSVPVILLETDQSHQNFRKLFPLVTEYIDRHYREAATRVFDGRFGTTLLVRKDRPPRGLWEPLGWPCFGPGRVRS